MITSNYKGVKIRGMATAVPTTWQSLKELAAKDYPNGFNLKKFEKTTGIKGRYQAAPKQTAADFYFAAAKAVMQKFDADISEIGAIIFVSQCSDYTTPATACVLQHRLGGGNKLHDCLAFDINLGCSGFIYGLNVISGLITNSDIRKALLLCGDTYAKTYSHMGGGTIVPVIRLSIYLAMPVLLPCLKRQMPAMICPLFLARMARNLLLS